MRTTIKKLLKFGLEKNDIKAEFELNDEQIKRYEKQGRGIEVDNLPELLEKYNTNKILKAEDKAKADIFDKVFNIVNQEIPNIDIKQKSELIEAMPKFFNELKINVAYDKVHKLEDQILEIKKQINAICIENNLLLQYPEIVDEQDEEKQKNIGIEIKDYVVDEKPKQFYFKYREDIYAQSSKYQLGSEKISFNVKKNNYNNVQIGDILNVSYEGKTYKYEVIAKAPNPTKTYVRTILMQD